MPATSKAQEFLAHADNCRRQAKQCSTDNEKQHWLTMAEEWMKMACADAAEASKSFGSVDQVNCAVARLAEAIRRSAGVSRPLRAKPTVSLT